MLTSNKVGTIKRLLRILKELPGTSKGDEIRKAIADEFGPKGMEFLDQVTLGDLLNLSVPQILEMIP